MASCACPRRCRGLTEGVTACAVGLRLWSSGVPPARRQQGRVKSRHAALRSAYRVMAECRRSATMCADVGGDGVTRPLAPSGWRRCSGAGMASVEDEVRRADPLSVNPGQRPGREDEEICTAWRCRCRCSAGVCQRRRSAAHVCRRGQTLPLLREAVMGVARPLRYDACLSGGERRVYQENVVGGTSERRV